MSIRLLQSVFIAGVDTPVDGSTLTLSPALEADLVNSRKAEWAYPPAQETQPSVRVVMSVGTPFLIPPGDGSSVGLQFTGSAGAYTLSAAIIADGWNFFRGGFWMCLPASFGGSAYPAGWYWSIMSSDTAGILYANTYTSGATIGPATPRAFPVNLTGWLTTTTAEIVGPTGFVIPAKALGKSGLLTTTWKLFGNILATKSFFQRIADTRVFQVNTSTAPSVEIQSTVKNAGIENEQNNTRSPGTAALGVGVAGSATIASAASESTSIDTGKACMIELSLKINATNGCAALLGCTSVVFPGD